MNLQNSKGKGTNYTFKRDSANEWFNAAQKAGRFAGAAARDCLVAARKSGLNGSSDNQVCIYERDATDFGTAQFMISNPPTRDARNIIERQICSLQNPKGPTFIQDANGATIDLRPDGAQQRFRNNKLEGSDPVEVIELDDDVSKLDDCCVKVDSKLTSSSVGSNVADNERNNRVMRLKKKAMDDIRGGSPKTKKVSKKLFETYQQMGRSKTKYEDKIEMLQMYDQPLRKKAFSSIEAHSSFKSLEDE